MVIRFLPAGCYRYLNNRIHQALSEDWMIKGDNVLNEIREEIVEPCLVLRQLLLEA